MQKVYILFCTFGIDLLMKYYILHLQVCANLKCYKTREVMELHKSMCKQECSSWLCSELFFLDVHDASVLRCGSDASGAQLPSIGLKGFDHFITYLPTLNVSIESRPPAGVASSSFYRPPYKSGSWGRTVIWILAFDECGADPELIMTIKTETEKPALTYSKSRGLVELVSAFMKQRKMGLNDFIQKLSTNSYACKHPEVQSILNLTPPQDPELMNSNPSPPPSPSQQINLGPSSNPSAKPSDFHFLKVIGKGSFGKVLLARHRSDDQFYAVKVLQKKAILKKKEEKHIMSERNVLLKNVKHPFLVGLHYSFQTADKLYFVLDYINGGELFYHLQRERCFLEPRARFYAAEIGSALGYLHSLNIVYRDLKPENILLDSQGHIILTDFGLCKENIEPNGTTSTFCGTPEYLAPEVLHKQPYDRTVDWWCLGAVLYEMLYGLPPFYSRNTAEMYDNILNKPLQLKPNISNAARHLLEGLLQKDRTKRLGCTEDFIEIKNHIFFSPINWDELNAKKITPPFNPNVTGPNDLRHFDPEFTDEPVPSSIGCSPDCALATASIKEAAEAFVGFSYAPSMDSYL
ncbi:serine/threonine-protein kinase Sgk1 isoform X2 [Girardinichthys multiradiatus]|uniref:serine/threonine-protein kinase Sgk1 isoform X2 n=1 Tax=Girardinichthys multiradiatus TaxID=208333 RepID=UPI001FAD2C8C|nr:serine/threonine-protein kinase Sgk1 isoform X2 [Girardinichthys multiradiatus]